jgi:hypothetical protein
MFTDSLLPEVDGLQSVDYVVRTVTGLMQMYSKT